MSSPSNPHRIRLRGPWEVRPHGDGHPVRRLYVPGTVADAGLAGHRGLVSFSRRFGRPTNLGPDESVWLVLDGIVGQAAVAVNGEPLGPVAGSGRFNITGLLADRNVLAVEIDVRDGGAGIVGEVALEVGPGR